VSELPKGALLELQVAALTAEGAREGELSDGRAPLGAAADQMGDEAPERLSLRRSVGEFPGTSPFRPAAAPHASAPRAS